MAEPAQTPQSERTPQAGGRARLLFALGLAGLLAVAAIVLVGLSGGEEEEHEFTAAPVQCLEGWNDDDAAVTLGTHQYDAHGYNRVQVLTLSSDGSAPVPASQPTALCTVLFASVTLDPEAAAAGMVQQQTGWKPLVTLQPVDQLTDYQKQAQEEYNAELQRDGTIEPL